MNTFFTNINKTANTFFKNNKNDMILFFVILLASILSSFFLPWWVEEFIAFIAAFGFGRVPYKSFLSGFFAAGLIWCILILVKTIPNDYLLANRVVQLFPLPNNWIYLMALSVAIGGVLCGMASLTGVLLRRAV
jgi:hypothetical protein